MTKFILTIPEARDITIPIDKVDPFVRIQSKAYKPNTDPKPFFTTIDGIQAVVFTNVN